MGSHGGATAEGQLDVLRSLGITEDYLGCPVESSMEVREIGRTPDGRPVQIDARAAAADGIVAVNRVKPHTSFTGPYESGLMKMLAIGLAKQAGAEVCHQEGYANMAANIEKYGRAILRDAKVLFGVAILENAYDQTCEVTALPPEEIAKREPALLLRAKALMPGILLPNVDVLVVDRMGKNISGLGMDPHITGCFATGYASGPPPAGQAGRPRPHRRDPRQRQRHRRGGRDHPAAARAVRSGGHLPQRDHGDPHPGGPDAAGHGQPQTGDPGGDQDGAGV